VQQSWPQAAPSFSPFSGQTGGLSTSMLPPIRLNRCRAGLELQTGHPTCRPHTQPQRHTSAFSSSPSFSVLRRAEGAAASEVSGLPPSSPPTRAAATGAILAPREEARLMAALMAACSLGTKPLVKQPLISSHFTSSSGGYIDSGKNCRQRMQAADA
jgi:hypothetical protein